MLTALGVTFLGVMLFLVLREQSEKIALTALGFYLLEVALLAVSRMDAFSLLRFSQAYVVAGQPADLLLMGQVAYETGVLIDGRCDVHPPSMDMPWGFKFCCLLPQCQREVDLEIILAEGSSDARYVALGADHDVPHAGDHRTDIWLHDRTFRMFPLNWSSACGRGQRHSKRNKNL